MQWENQSERADFSWHPMIADRILRPVIETHSRAMPLWRFHRRAAADAAGHQFSFIFYGTPETAAEIRDAVESNDLVHRLLKTGILKTVIFSDGQSDGVSEKEATSDPAWPPEVQRSWPYFIMGVSQSWLDQIAQLRQSFPGSSENSNPDHGDLETLLEYYMVLNDRLNSQWTRYGRHAYFHHINALFGYEPVYLHETGELHRF